MADAGKHLTSARRDPLTAGERLAVCAAVFLVFEGASALPRDTMLHFLRTGLPALRSDADFAALSLAAKRLLDADGHFETMAALARLRAALLPVLVRDFNFALRDAFPDAPAGEVRDAG